MSIVLKGYNSDISDYKPSVDFENRIIRGFISTPFIDRDGEIVLPSAFERDIPVYESNPILLLHHNHKSLPVGSAYNLKITPKGLWAEYKIASTQLGTEVLTLVNEGHLRGFSPGFIPIDFATDPPTEKIPQEYMRTSNGKRCKKIYSRVELVEVSLLAIPSNRDALIDRAEKGNSAADLICKMFDIEAEEDISGAIEEWTRDHYSKIAMKGLLQYIQSPSRGILKGLMEDNSTPCILKGFLETPQTGIFKSLIWNENEHPRDKDGQFTPKMEGNDALDSVVNDVEEAARKKVQENRIVKLMENQDEMRKSLKSIENKDSWSEWAKKWGIRALVATGAYFALYKTEAGKKLRQKAKDRISEWVKDQLRKNLIPDVLGKSATVEDADLNELNQALHSMETIAVFLKRGKELGLEDSEEYGKALLKYNSLFNDLKNIVQEKEASDFVKKAMTSETFDESEHPRHTDGKFRKKADSSRQESHVEVSEDTKVSKQERKNKSQNRSKQDNSYLKEWAKKNANNKYVVLGIAAIPFTLGIVKAGKVISRVAYSESSKRVVSWDKLTKLDKIKFFNNVEPGDIFLQGGKQHQGIVDLAKDIAGKGSRGEQESKNAVADAIAKAVDGGQYPHSAMILGKYDDNFHNRLISEITGNDKTRQRAGNHFIALSLNALGLDGNEAKSIITGIRKRDKKAILRLKDELSGSLVIATAQDDPKHADVLKMLATFNPYGGLEASGAILRTKVPLKQRQDLSSNVLNAVFNRDSIGVRLSRDNRHVIADRISGRRTANYIRKDNGVLCSGLIYNLYDKYGGTNFKKNAAFVTTGDILKDKKLSSLVLEPKKNGNYSFDDWTLPEEPSGQISGKAKATGGLAAVGAGAVTALNEYEKTKQKGFVSKAMSKEDFKEQEHPRDDSGKFTDKPGSSAKTSKTKTSWGGAREGAGRLSNKAHVAVETRREQYAKKFPKLTQDQRDEKIRQEAIDKLKPDWIEYLDDPQRYHDKREQEIKEALLAKYDNMKSKGQTVKKPRTSEETGDIRTSVRETRAEFEREKEKQQTVFDAWKTFKDKSADKLDRDRAKLILAATTVVSAMMLSSFLYKRPKLRDAGIKVAKEGLEKVEGLAGVDKIPFYKVGHLTGLPGKKNWTDITESPTWFKWAKVTGEQDEKTVVGSIRRAIGTAVQRVSGEKGTWSLEGMGGKWTGRLDKPQYFGINLDSVESRAQFRFIAGDLDAKTLLPITTSTVDNKGVRTTIVNSDNLIQLVMGKKGWKEGENIKGLAAGLVWKKGRSLPELKDPPAFFSWMKKKGYLRHLDLKTEELAQKFAEGKAYHNIDFSKSISPELLPDRVIRDWDGVMSLPVEGKPVKETRDLAFSREAYRGYAEFLNEEFVGPFSRKALALMALATGSSGYVYYLHMDVVRASQGIKEQMNREKSLREKRLKIEEKAQKASEEAASKSAKQELAIEKEKTKQAQSQSRGKSTQLAIEQNRSKFIQDLAKAGFRREEEGAVPTWGTKPDTAARRLNSSQLASIASQALSDSGIPLEAQIDLFRSSPSSEDFLAIVRDRYIQKHSIEDWQNFLAKNGQTITDEAKTSKYGIKGFNSLVTKEPNNAYALPVIYDMDYVQDMMAYDFAQQLADISQCCRDVIESGMPGHDGYEDLNDIVLETYGALKDKVKSEEDTNISEKSFDSGTGNEVMSSTDDSSSGMFVSGKQETCPICHKEIKKDGVIGACNRKGCPYKGGGDFGSTDKEKTSEEDGTESE